MKVLIATVTRVLGISILASLASCGGESTPEKPLPPTAARDTRQESYDWQEKCARNAREWFKQLYDDGEQIDNGTETHTRYTNHYNAKGNRCYVLLETTGFQKESKTGEITMTESKTLIDVNENKDLASYFAFVNPPKVMLCRMAEAHCRSSKEWKALVRPYMEQ